MNEMEVGLLRIIIEIIEEDARPDCDIMETLRELIIIYTKLKEAGKKSFNPD